MPRLRPDLAVLVSSLALFGPACAEPSPEPSTSPAPSPDAANERDTTRPSVAPPLYKQSSKSEAAMAITKNAYGSFRPAPNAPQLKDTLPDFTLPLANGGTFDLAQARASGPVAIVFYRGFW